MDTLEQHRPNRGLLSKEDDVGFYRTELRVMQATYSNEEFLNTVATLLSDKSNDVDDTSAKEEIWNRFMENMKLEVKRGEEPVLPMNFLGSVEKHREQFMKIDISDLTK